VTRTKDYNQKQRGRISALRERMVQYGPEFVVVDMKRTPHTNALYNDGGCERFEPRTMRQVQLYGFVVVHK
jgi:hypothetical protein